MKHLLKSILVLVLCLGLASPAAGFASPVSAVSKEPFYAGIIATAGQLQAQTDTFSATGTLSLLASPEFSRYAAAIRDLSARDLKGHEDLKARGTDRDLKCILKGVSLDLGLKLAAVQTAKSDADLKAALSEMSLLLSDNIDVIATPATADSGLDCVIEFGAGA